jgi:hypothetical protein
MVDWYRSVSWCLERAAHYDQKAERAVDPAARQSFVDAANRWRQSAEIYQSMEWIRADPSKQDSNAVPSPPTSMGARASFAQHVFGKLGSWSKRLGLNRVA